MLLLMLPIFIANLLYNNGGLKSNITLQVFLNYERTTGLIDTIFSPKNIHLNNL